MACPVRRVNGATMVFLGVAFKANIDDLRASLSLGVANAVSDICEGSLIVAGLNISSLLEPLFPKAELMGLI